ncbi:MAG: c-type cytochrome [Planctomycetes bacterium]|nr:c-type cytochrome [Planctomycetota bacterium]
MRTTTLLLVASLASALLAGTAVRTLASSGEGAPTTSPVERGKYLVASMACNDCHTPWTMGPEGPMPDMTRELSGHPAGLPLSTPPTANADWPTSTSATMTAWSGPWGTSFTANLTPDRETGLGTWTAEEFLAAMRTGRHQGRGRAILPPMPWTMIRNLDDQDLRAIFAYLQSIPAISNRVPEPLPPTAQ